MTPEEQFMKIDNALRHAAEIGAKHAEEIAKDQAAIRDLIVISRTLLDTAKQHSEQIKANGEQIKANGEDLASWKKAWEEERQRSREESERSREEFETKFNALLQAHLETEQALRRWLEGRDPA